jgi:hypothetical protein
MGMSVRALGELEGPGPSHLHQGVHRLPKACTRGIPTGSPGSTRTCGSCWRSVTPSSAQATRKFFLAEEPDGATALRTKARLMALDIPAYRREHGTNQPFSISSISTRTTPRLPPPSSMPPPPGPGREPLLPRGAFPLRGRLRFGPPCRRLRFAPSHDDDAWNHHWYRTVYEDLGLAKKYDLLSFTSPPPPSA